MSVVTLEAARYRLEQHLARLPVLRDARVAPASHLDCAGFRAFAATGPGLVGARIYLVDAERILGTGEPEPAFRAVLIALRDAGEPLAAARFARLFLDLYALRGDIVLMSLAELAAIRPAPWPVRHIAAPSAATTVAGIHYSFTALDPRRDELIRWDVVVDHDAALDITMDMLGPAPRAPAGHTGW